MGDICRMNNAERLFNTIAEPLQKRLSKELVGGVVTKVEVGLGDLSGDVKLYVTVELPGGNTTTIEELLAEGTDDGGDDEIAKATKGSLSVYLRGWLDTDEVIKWWKAAKKAGKEVVLK